MSLNQRNVRLTRRRAGKDSQLRTTSAQGIALEPEVGFPFVLVASPLSDLEADFRRVTTGRVVSVVTRDDEPNLVWFETRSGSWYEVEYLEVV